MWPTNLAGSPKQQSGTYLGVLRILEGTFPPHNYGPDGDSYVSVI